MTTLLQRWSNTLVRALIVIVIVIVMPQGARRGQTAKGPAISLSATQSEHPLPVSVRLAYAFGQLSEGIKNESFTIFLLFFYTNIMGLSGLLAGQAILIALMFDAVTDPLIGTLSDRTTGRLGRRHPYMYASAIPLGIAFYLVFAPPKELSQRDLFLWMTTMVVLCRGAMTLFHVPHLALGAELSSDYQVRTKVVAERMIFSRIGAAIAGIVGFIWYLRPTQAYPDGRFNGPAYAEFALLFAIIMALVIIISSYCTRSQIPYLCEPAKDEGAQHALLATLSGTGQILKIRSFRALFLASIASAVGWGLSGTLLLHMATFFWHISSTQLIIFGFAAGTSIFFGLSFWSQAAARWNKKVVFIAGLLMYTGFTAPPYLLKAVGYWPAEASMLYFPLFVFVVAVMGPFGIAATMVTAGSMMADVTDEDELRSGRRREGLFFGANAFAGKAAFGVGALLAGVITDFSGVDNLTTAKAAGSDVVFQLGMAQGCCTLFLMALSVILLSRYNLTQQRLKHIQQEIHQRSLHSAE